MRLISSEIVRADEQTILSSNPEEWKSRLVDKYELQPIDIDNAREEQMEELDGDPPRIFYKLPVTPTDDTLGIIIGKKLNASTQFPGFVGGIIYKSEEGYLGVACGANEHEIKRTRDALNKQIEWWNKDITQENQTFSNRVRTLIDNRLHRISDKNKTLDQLSTSTGIRLKKRTDVENVIPVELPIKRNIQPLLKTGAKRSRGLDRDTLEAIVDLLDKQGRQFERTPAVFGKLHEEKLRDIMLSTLNAVFESSATGETFSVHGKCDIHIPIADGEVFIAECKWWGGEKTLVQVLTQLLERLTWHESYGTIILFVKNTDFGIARQKVLELLPHMSGAMGQPRTVKDNQYTQNFRLPSDNSTQVEVRVLIYNLYVTRKSRKSQ